MDIKDGDADATFNDDGASIARAEAVPTTTVTAAATAARAAARVAVADGDSAVYESVDGTTSRPDEFTTDADADAAGDADVEDSINVIEDGEHVSTEDFGLSSAEISMHAPIGMELNAMQQIDAFLARPTHDGLRRERVAQAMDKAENDVTASAQHATRLGDEHEQVISIEQVLEHSHATVGSVTPSRREDKASLIQAHPIVDSVSIDGRVILCKCGKSVRLNPPWYILKFEQHIVSRNCTFLRKKKSSRQQDREMVTANMGGLTDAIPNRKNAAVMPETRTTVTGEQRAAVSDTADMESQALSGTDAASSVEEEASVRVADGDVEPMEIEADSSEAHGSVAIVSAASATVVAPSDSVAVVETHPDDGSYGLKSAATLLHTYTSASTSDRQGGMNMRQVLLALKAHPHFSRITPDGRFLECKCSTLLILSAPWNPSEFLSHVAQKGNPPKPTRRRPQQQTGALKRTRLGAGAAYRIEQRLLQRDIRWQPAATRGTLPCPGFGGDRVTAFISSTSQITGGSRSRHRIARTLFPHHFAASETNRAKVKLTSDEKVVLHDAVESEALWFIDREGSSLRSLDCKGTIEASKNEHICANCAELSANTSLRLTMMHAAQKRKPLTSAVSAKYCHGRPFSLLEQEFDMQEEYARVLRDLFLAEVDEGSVKNVWFDMAEMGMASLFQSNPEFLGLIESMMTVKDKERRGVGLQNMSYSEDLDVFMKSLSDASTDACDFFQNHLGGRKQKYLAVCKKRRPGHSVVFLGRHDSRDGASKGTEQPILDSAGGDGHRVASSTTISSADNFSNLTDGAVSGTALNNTKMAVMNLAAFSAHIPAVTSNESDLRQDNGALAHDGTDGYDEEEEEESDGFLTDENVDASDSVNKPPAMTPGFLPCKGLRDPKVQAYVTNAVQIIGGSRPKYVIAKELFPEVFDGAKHVKITEKLNDEQRLVLQDAVFSECLWRVDKLGNCVRSLRCFRRVDAKRSGGVCRACLELKGIANFRSVLCRAKVPKKMENIKFVPSVYTESDPFIRKLSKNASLRALYQAAKGAAAEDRKKVTFWLRFAKMGLFGHFRSHPVFEGLIGSMVEIKDKERRGVGKQNMQYAKPLDDFMSALAAISMDAFELFTEHFCGRTTRSQKVKKRKAMSQLHDAALMSVTEAVPSHSAMFPAPVPSVADNQSGQQHHVGHHHLLTADDLLAARPMSTADIEESQRFMDRMLDEVRLSVHHDIQLQDVQDVGAVDGELHHEEKEHEHDEQGDQLDPGTYLDENGVLTTVL